MASDSLKVVIDYGGSQQTTTSTTSYVLGGENIVINPTPAIDLRGASATSTAPYNNMRPSVTEDAQTIVDRTSVIQAAIDAASNAGGGQVILPSGVFQCNQIVLKDRVILLGQGSTRTTLLDAGNDTRTAAATGNLGQGFITTENYGTNKALGSTNGPKWREDGAVTNVGVVGVTVDGQGFTLTNDTEWDFLPTSQNIGSSYGGLYLFASGIVVHDVRIVNFDGDGARIDRGGQSKNGHYTPSDETSSKIGTLTIQNCTGAGINIGGHPDGSIDRLIVSKCGEVTQKAGLVISGQFWHINFAHIWACYYGLQNSGTNYYNFLEVEFCSSYGAGFLQLVGDEIKNTVVDTLLVFSNSKSAGSVQVSIKERVHIKALNMDMDRASKIGLNLESTAGGTRVTGVINADLDSSAGPTGLVFVDMTDLSGADGAQGNCVFELSGDCNDAPSCNVVKMRGASLANRMNLDFRNMAGSGTNLIVAAVDSAETSDEAIVGSNRINVYYDATTVASGEAYYTTESTPEIALIAY